MSKPTVAQLRALIEAQSARIDALELEVRRLHRGKAEAERKPTTARRFKDMASAARAYCKEFGVRSCTPAQVRDWLAA